MIHNDEFMTWTEGKFRQFIDSTKVYDPLNLFLNKSKKGMFEVRWLENLFKQIVAGPFHEVDFFDYSIAEWVNDPRNITTQEHELLEPYRKDIVEYYGYDKWNELIKGATAKAMNDGRIKTGLGECRNDSFDASSFVN